MKVKLWNDNIYDFKQRFKEVDYSIPAKGFIEIEEDEAHQLVCAYYPVERDAGGKQKPHSYKMLRIEGRSQVAADPYQCLACGYKAYNALELKAHTEARLDDGVHKALSSYGDGMNVSAKDVLAAMDDETKQELVDMLLASAPKARRGRPKKDVREAIQE